MTKIKPSNHHHHTKEELTFKFLTIRHLVIPIILLLSSFLWLQGVSVSVRYRSLLLLHEEEESSTTVDSSLSLLSSSYNANAGDDDSDDNNNLNKIHRVFIVVGAVRTLQYTEISLLQNWIIPLCPPAACVAHLVTHLSYTDNRPNTKSADPRGSVVEIPGDSAEGGRGGFFLRSSSNNNNNNHGGYLIQHIVDGYNIASSEEQAAMDLLEKESSPELAARIKIWRTADPRRFSMWFARAWAWRFAQRAVLPRLPNGSADFIAFCRPDLFWMIPLPAVDFFQNYTTTNNNLQNSIWVHDTYYAQVPDTFAMLPSPQVATTYFSIDNLLRPGVACLGGPDFNRDLVEQRLRDADLSVSPEDWCNGESHGWSENILGRRLANLNVLRFPASTVIMRPPHHLDCQSLHPKLHSGKHSRSYVPFVTCVAIRKAIYDQPDQSSIDTTAVLQQQRIFRLQNDQGDCLTLQYKKASKRVLVETLFCEYPIPPYQLFSNVIGNETMLEGYYVSRPLHLDSGSRRSFHRQLIPLPNDDVYARRPVPLYSASTLDPAPPTTNTEEKK